MKKVAYTISETIVICVVACALGGCFVAGLLGATATTTDPTMLTYKEFSYIVVDTNNDGTGLLIDEDFLTTFTADIDELVDDDGDTKVQVEEGADDDVFRVDTAGTERMAISNVGVFTLNTGGHTVQSLGASLDGNLILSVDTTNGPDLNLIKDRASAYETYTIVQDDDLLGSVGWLGGDGSSWRDGARIDAYVDGTPGAADMPGRLVFLTTPDGSATPATALKIDQAQIATFYNDVLASTSLTINHEQETDDGPYLTLLKTRTDTALDNDEAGMIYFNAEDDAGAAHNFGFIKVIATDVSNGGEDARMTLHVATDSVAFQQDPLLTLEGSGVTLPDQAWIGVENALPYRTRILFDDLQSEIEIRGGGFVFNPGNEDAGSAKFYGDTAYIGAFDVGLDKFIINPDEGAVVDMQISGDTVTNLFYSDSSTDRIGIGTNAPDYILDVAGDVGIDDYIYHNGDTNTFIRLSADQNRFDCGGVLMLRMVEGSTTDEIEHNPGMIDVDHRFYSDVDECVRIDGGTGTSIFNYTQSADADLQVYSDTSSTFFKCDVGANSGVGSVQFESDSSTYLIGINSDADYYDVSTGWNHESTRRVKMNIVDVPSTGSIMHHGKEVFGPMDALQLINAKFYEKKKKRRDYVTPDAGVLERDAAQDYVNVRVVPITPYWDDDLETTVTVRAMTIDDLKTTVTITEEGSGRWHYGLIAEELEAFGLSDGNGINNDTLIAALWQGSRGILKRQNKIIARQNLQDRRIAFIRNKCIEHGIDMTGFPMK